MTETTILGDEGRPPEQTLGALVRNSLGWSFANNVFGRSLTFVSSLVLARLLEPREFGVFAIALVVYSLLISLNDVGIFATIVRWPGNIDDVAPTATTLIFLTSVVAYGVFFVAAPYCCRLVGAPDATGVTRLLALAIIVDGIFAVPVGMLTRYFRQDRRTIADLVNAVVATVVSILLAFHGYGVWSLAWGRLLGNLIGAILCTAFSEHRYRPGFNFDAAKKLLRSGAPLLGTTVVTIGVLNVDYLTIGRILGPTALGYYVLAFNVSSWAISIFSLAIDRVTLPTFARLRSNPVALRMTFIRATSMLCLVILPVCTLMAAMNHPLILFMYGSKWVDSTDALEFLALFAVVRIIVNLAMDTLIAVGHSSITFMLQSCWLAVLIPALIIGARTDGITGVAIGHVIVGFGVVVPIYAVVIKRLGVSLRSLMKHLAWPVLGAVLTAFVSHNVAGHFHTPFVALLVGGSCGLFVYVLAVLPLRNMLKSSSGLLEIAHGFPVEGDGDGYSLPEPPHLSPDGSGPAQTSAELSARDLLADVDAVPVWFGPPDRLLFGWLHVPETNTARAGVVLCPSLGIEGRRAHVAYRILAATLARRGFLVLRFDYDGTGDSVGRDDDPDRVAAWTASVREATCFLVATGVSSRVVVGMRAGATIAANAGFESALDAMIFWDPCASGRRFVREHQLLLRVIDPTGEALDDGVELPGQVLSNSTVLDLSALRLEALPANTARRLLVLERPAQQLEARVRDRLSSIGAEWGDALGQSELLEAISPDDEPPLATIASISSWLETAVDAARQPVTLPPMPACAVVGRSRTGTTMTEHVVRLGPLGLVGVVTECATGDRSGPLVVMLNDGHDHHVGPARLWVDLAREWGGLGIRSVRIDASGIGDSPLRPGQTERICYPPEIFDDLAAVTGELSDDPRNVILIGVCSGAFHAIDCGVDLGVLGICAINPALSPFPRHIRRPGLHTPPRMVNLLASIHPRLSKAASLSIAQIAPRKSAAGPLFLLQSGGTASLVVCGDHEARQFQRLIHWNRTLRTLSSTGGFRFEQINGLQHSVLNLHQRELTTSLLTEFVVSLSPAAVGASATSGTSSTTELPAAALRRTPGLETPA